MLRQKKLLALNAVPEFHMTPWVAPRAHELSKHLIAYLLGLRLKGFPARRSSTMCFGGRSVPVRLEIVRIMTEGVQTISLSAENYCWLRSVKNAGRSVSGQADALSLHWVSDVSSFPNDGSAY